jgi:hypothetical protein
LKPLQGRVSKPHKKLQQIIYKHDEPHTTLPKNEKGGNCRLPVFSGQGPYLACFGMVGNELMTTYTLKTHTQKKLSSSKKMALFIAIDY